LYSHPFVVVAVVFVLVGYRYSRWKALVEGWLQGGVGSFSSVVIFISEKLCSRTCALICNTRVRGFFFWFMFSSVISFKYRWPLWWPFYAANDAWHLWWSWLRRKGEKHVGLAETFSPPIWLVGISRGLSCRKYLRGLYFRQNFCVEIWHM